MATAKPSSSRSTTSKPTRHPGPDRSRPDHPVPPAATTARARPDRCQRQHLPKTSPPTRYAGNKRGVQLGNLARHVVEPLVGDHQPLQAAPGVRPPVRYRALRARSCAALARVRLPQKRYRPPPKRRPSGPGAPQPRRTAATRAPKYGSVPRGVRAGRSRPARTARRPRPAETSSVRRATQRHRTGQLPDPVVAFPPQGQVIEPDLRDLVSRVERSLGLGHDAGTALSGGRDGQMRVRIGC